jgi:hypothetical protein
VYDVDDRLPANTEAGKISFDHPYHAKDSTMNQRGSSFPLTALITLLGGATVGGLAVALTTTQSGREFRGTLKSLGNRLLGRTGSSDDSDDDLIRAMFI